MPPSLRVSLSFAALFALGGHARAAQPDVPAISLDEALAKARQQEPRIRAALAELDARRAEARVPRYRWMPRIGAVIEVFGGSNNDTTAVNINVPEADFARAGATGGRTPTTARWTPEASTLAGISATQEIYDFGRIAAQSAVADAVAAIASADVEAARLDVQLAVEESFHGVLAAHEIERATEEAYKRAITHRDYAQAGTKSGLRPPIELTRAQADVARLEVQRVRAGAGVRTARAALAASVGAAELELDAKPLAEDQSATPAFDEVMRTAALRNPAMAVALARIDEQHARTRVLTRDLVPNLFLSTSISGRAGGFAPGTGDVPYGNGWLPDVGNWGVGLVLSWRIFDGAVIAERSASKARENAARAQLDLARINVGLGAQRAYIDLDAAVRALPGLQQSVTAAQANQAQAEARYKAGLGNVVELADAEAVLTRAQLDLAVGEFTVARARAALGYAMGSNTISRKAP